MKQAHSRPTTSCAVVGKTTHVALSGRTCVVSVGQSKAGGSSGVAEELPTTRVTLNGQRCGRLWAVGIDGEVAAKRPTVVELGGRRPEAAVTSLKEPFVGVLLTVYEKAMFDIGHEDDLVIELANEVRKVLGIVGVGIPVEKKKSGSSRIPLKSHIQPLQLRPLPEVVAIDS